MVSYERIPSKMHRPAKRYVEEGVIPGDFLQAVLRDSLTESYGRSDKENKEAMEDYVMWLYNDIPGSCWGSQEAIGVWHSKGGLEGVRDE